MVYENIKNIENYEQICIYEKNGVYQILDNFFLWIVIQNYWNYQIIKNKDAGNFIFGLSCAAKVEGYVSETIWVECI